MGIEHFASRMRKHGLTVDIGPVHHHSHLAVIDGPSLAHFVFDRLEHRELADKTIVPRCNYRKLGDAVIEWVDRLRRYGFEIEGIYFDGALSSQKQQVRARRLENHVNKLVKFRQLHRGISSEAFVSRQDYEYLYARENVRPAAFLVFAVIEALRRSHYGNVTWVVAGEADPFCAAAARIAERDRPGTVTTIFSDDSDLLIYNSGEQTRVALIKSVTERNEYNDPVLQAFQFWPRQLANLAPIQMLDLTLPACIMLNPIYSFQAALNASKFEAHTKQLQEFVDSYDVIVPMATLERSKARRKNGEEVLQTDSRISELVHQAVKESELRQDRDYDELMGREPQVRATVHLCMFLPKLTEDPERSSAWRVGIKFRLAAYELLREHFRLPPRALECRRSGHRVNSYANIIGQNTITQYNVPKCLVEWMQNERKTMSGQSKLDNVHSWRIFIMKLLMYDMVDQKLDLPATRIFADILAEAPLTSWQHVHLSACFEAEYYSLRMLKEIQEFLPSQSSDPEIQSIYELLQSIPSVVQFCNPKAEGGLAYSEEFWQVPLQEFRELLNVDEVEVEEEIKEEEEAMVGIKEEPFDDNNPFGILGEE